MNKKMKVMVGFIVVIICVAFVVIIWVVISSFTSDKNKAEKVFNEDRELLETVTYYLESIDHENMYFYKTMPVDGIEDKSVSEAVVLLFNRGYDAIGKSGNTIFFLRWTRLKDFGAGFAYSINKKYKPTMEYLLKLEPLSVNGWYYYEAN